MHIYTCYFDGLEENRSPMYMCDFTAQSLDELGSAIYQVQDETKFTIQ